MKPIHWVFLLVLFLSLAACTGGIGSTPLPTAQVGITPAPDAEATLQAYLDAYQAEDFASMYGLLTEASRAGLSQEDFQYLFTGKRDSALNAMSVRAIEYSILSILTRPESCDVAFRITYQTVLYGDISRDFSLTLVRENGNWRLPWDTGLILPELAGGRHLHSEYVSPSRGDIYDRSGNPIATQSDIYALSLVSGQANEEHLSVLFNKLWFLTGRRPELIRTDYANYAYGQAVPVGEASAQLAQESGVLNYSGVQYASYSSRYYGANLAAQAVGYLLYISPEEYDGYRREGYSGGERVGVQGIEKWAEPYLHGHNQAILYQVGADGSFETILSQVDSQPADSLYLTIDNDLQAQAQAAMDGLPGAIVVMEVNTGRILAMVSSPGYDPNLYDPDNPNNSAFNALPVFSANEAEWSTFSRATQGSYPLGSVFKIVTMAAGLESGLFTAESTWDCDYLYTEISGVVLKDWTYDRCEAQKADTGRDTCPSWPASGTLTLPEGLMRSCDPWFYHIGYTLYSAGLGNTISDMARAFGLGSATGIEQVAEAEGHIPDPTDGTNATSIAIGQGDVLVTPLQVVRFIAAIANGGTLYRPQLVERIQPVSGQAVTTFAPEVSSTLPVSPENLATIQEAMRQVVANQRGTAYRYLAGFSIPTAAKTGTAESGTADPHAWFAGYSLAGWESKPDIAVVVVVNNQGEGSVWAEPIFRRMMEIYYFGQPGVVYPWESSIGVVNPDYGVPVPTPTPGP